MGRFLVLLPLLALLLAGCLVQEQPKGGPDPDAAVWATMTASAPLPDTFRVQVVRETYCDWLKDLGGFVIYAGQSFPVHPYDDNRFLFTQPDGSLPCLLDRKDVEVIR